MPSATLLKRSMVVLPAFNLAIPSISILLSATRSSSKLVCVGCIAVGKPVNVNVVALDVPVN